MRHVVRQCTGEQQSDYVDPDDIQAGLELSRWFGGETLRVYGAMSATPEQPDRCELLKWIAGRGRRVTVRDLQRNLRRYVHDPDRAEADLRALVDEGLGAWQYVPPGPTGRKPTHVFCLADHPDFPVSGHTDADSTSENQ